VAEEGEEGGAAPADEDLAAQLQAELESLKVTDILLQTVALASTIAYRRLTPESRDLEEARLAIDTLRALVPLLEARIPADAGRDMQQAVMNLQLLYASAAAPPAPPPSDDEGEKENGGG
jgi:hypothetical protein